MRPAQPTPPATPAPSTRRSTPSPPPADAPLARSRRPSTGPEQLGRGPQGQRAHDEEVHRPEVLVVPQRSDPEAEGERGREEEQYREDVEGAGHAWILPAL